MKKLNKIFATIATLAVCAVSMSTITANASTEDSDITNFTAPPGVANTYSSLPTSQHGIRTKGTDSSVYLKVTKSTYNVRVQTWGLADAYWSNTKENLTLNAYGSPATSVTVSSGYSYQIKNKIYEGGYYTNYYGKYPCAGLKFASTNQYNQSSITGVWSPDYTSQAGVIVAN